MNPDSIRQSTGVNGLDAALGGGLIPGTLTVVVGATGIGKTQLGLQFANAGAAQEGQRGILFDMTARGDSQSHAEYAGRMFGWNLTPVDTQQSLDLGEFFTTGTHGDYLHVFDYRGQRVTRRDLEWEQWHEWQGQLNIRLRSTIAFMYGNFAQGVRRLVIDGIEPVVRPGDSIQFNLFEYIYHQILRKDPEWVARDLFRERFLHHADEAAQHLYSPADIGCLLLCTSSQTMLDELISRPLDEGDVIANANTLILMGKLRDGDRIGRGLYIAKHRGSSCVDRILSYDIAANGLTLA